MQSSSAPPTVTRRRRRASRPLAALALLALLLPAPADAAAPSRYLRLDVLVVVYTRTFAGAADGEQVEALGQRIQEAAAAYWEGSGRRLRLALDTLTIDRPLREEQFDWYPPDQYWLGIAGRDGVPGVEQDLLARGLASDDYDAVAVFYAWEDRPGHRRRFGGAMLPVGSLLGKAAYLGIPLAASPEQLRAIFEHEMMHVLESIFERSGYADFPVIHNQDFFELVYGKETPWLGFVLGGVPHSRWLELDEPWGTVVEAEEEARDVP